MQAHQDEITLGRQIMTEEKYCFEVGEEGQQGLDILDHLFNPTTQQFILNVGLKPGMKVLDIGCGLGTITSWLAKQVLPSGTVTAIDNNEYQVKATLKRLKDSSIANAKAVCLSAYDLESLNETFDFVYCRFILHHINKPTDVIRSVYKILNPNGIFVAEEGLVSQAFSYPFTGAWGHERWHNDPKQHDTEGVSRDGNFGMKLYHVMHTAGFKDLHANLVQPVITSRSDKDLFIKSMFHAMDESKSNFIAEGHTEDEWQTRRDEIKNLSDDPSQIIAFYQSCQVKGVKSE